jgi:transcription-repair coupling factor (superfamily II helicase)
VKSALATFSADLIDLKPGDYVVHAEHGVGQFLGLREIAQGEPKGDYMLLEYAGGAKLYVPLARMDLVQRFRGAGEAKPALDRMGGATWTRTKTRIKAKMRDMADELLKLYAAAQNGRRLRVLADSNWQREFEDAFEFTETKRSENRHQRHQARHGSPQPMDRLLCGDVGYGKTEVVMRAAFKALGDGKQVAVLAPTTVLAFSISRPSSALPAVSGAHGNVQPLPHRQGDQGGLAIWRRARSIWPSARTGCSRKDVEFKDLGLVIVDEEQRFGVKHKERLKQMKKSVDVVTMSATPIPRTLHMSLLGLRDMSVIETPPKDRLAIHTVVAPFQPN